jgi:acetyl-CoA carboxylase biotin carboxyl carrier protein
VARRAPTTPASPLDRIRELAALLNEHGLTAISATWGGIHVRLERTPAAGPPATIISAAPAPVRIPQPSVVESTPPTQVAVEAPMVGTFYRASSPGAEPFVGEGDTVKEGQVLCIIEAMKLMNEIEAKVAARIVRVLVENGAAVEFGQPLFLVEPLR